MNIVIHPQQSSALLSISDRCFNYGDGFFTTIHARHGQLQLLPLHMQRLQLSANRLAFNNIDFEQLQRALLEVASSDPAVVKVVVSRGSGGRGYDPQGCQWQAHISKTEYPPMYAKWRSTGIKLGVSTIRLGKNPMLAGIKHCNRLEQVLIKQSLHQSDHDDAIVCDLDGNVVECSASNLFWQVGSQWYTGNLQQCGVEGVMKQFIIDKLPGFAQTQQVTVPLSHLSTANAAFICNSLMGIIPVRQLQTDLWQLEFDVNQLSPSICLLQQYLNA